MCRVLAGIDPPTSRPTVQALNAKTGVFVVRRETVLELFGKARSAPRSGGETGPAPRSGPHSLPAYQPAPPFWIREGKRGRPVLSYSMGASGPRDRFWPGRGRAIRPSLDDGGTHAHSETRRNMPPSKPLPCCPSLARAKRATLSVCRGTAPPNRTRAPSRPRYQHAWSAPGAAAGGKGPREAPAMALAWGGCPPAIGPHAGRSRCI